MQFLPLHRLFEQQVINTPGNIAITHGLPAYDDANSIYFIDTHYTYAQVNSLANQIAYLLQDLGVIKGDVVAIILERSVYTFATLLACSKLGAAFLLIDTHYPLERINYLLADAQPKLILTEDNLADPLNVYKQQKFLLFSDLIQSLKGKPATNLNIDVSAEDIAYVIYTSGTTGNPKGALIQHAGLHNWVNEQTKILKITSQDVILQFAPLSFDPSIWDMIMAFGHGAGLYLTPRETCVDGNALNVIFRDKGITGVTVTPIALSWLKPDISWQLRFLVSTGEAFKTHYAQKFIIRNIKLYNGYGPSETTIGVTLYKVKTADLEQNDIPIGQPIANTHIYILDNQHNRLPDGQEGEMYIAGHLAAGYINNPKLTTEKFIELTINAKKTRLYKTGDLGCYKNGLLYFRGRNDKQIKLHGKRIELEEIQRILLQNDVLQDVYLTTFTIKSEEKRIVAYLVPKKEHRLVKEDWYAYCAQKLPKYMIPSSFMPIAQLPLNHNGKVDEQRLPKPIRGRSAINADFCYIAPSDKTQQKLKDIWEKVLGWTSSDKPLSINDDFFEIGGASMLLYKLQHQIKQQFNLIYPIHKLVHDTTLAKQASYIFNATKLNYDANQRFFPLNDNYPQSSPPKILKLLSPLDEDDEQVLSSSPEDNMSGFLHKEEPVVYYKRFIIN
ncbi:MAG: mcnC [Gammaproteobacteria bacterium]|jgi:amino acid adenylation domain-containing protein|nr:mcnC [Gammaproteobacteria bacterium]